MSSRCQTYTILTCDNCGAELTSVDAGVAIASAPLVRGYAAENGWQFVQAILPMPPEHHGRETKRRQFDFCGQCGIPERIKFGVEALVPEGGGFKHKHFPGTVLSGVVLYGDPS